MEDIFVSPLIAKKAKIALFNKKCLAYYKGKQLIIGKNVNSEKEKTIISAPTYDQIQNWLIEEFNTCVEINSLWSIKEGINCYVNDKIESFSYSLVTDYSVGKYIEGFKTRNEALKKGIEKAFFYLKYCRKYRRIISISNISNIA